MRVGVDSGGTFTDICLFDENSGRIAVWRVASTRPIRRARSPRGLAKLARAAAPPSDVAYFGHGTAHRYARNPIASTHSKSGSPRRSGAGQSTARSAAARK